MKLSKSKLDLAKVINENGGWVYGANFSSQDYDGWVHHFRAKPTIDSGSEVWNHGGCIGKGHFKVGKIKNWHQTILSSEEYYQAYPKVDADGWIEWKGGECPVGKNERVDYKLLSGSVVTIGEIAGYLKWSHEFSTANIIAYRPHKPEVKPEFCESVMRSIPEPEVDDVELRLAKDLELVNASAHRLLSDKYKFNGDEVMGERKPTIEQMARDYRNKLDYANRKQQEADDAKSDADAALGELERAGDALGLLIGIAKSEPGLEITKRHQLKLGDVIWIGKSKFQLDEERLPSGEYVVVKLGTIGLLHNEKTFYPDFSARDWKFIRRQ